MPDGDNVAWYSTIEGIDADTIGHIQTKGWDKKPANEVAIEAIRSHRAAELKLGVPADQILRLPKDMTDATAMKPIWQRLGAPAEAKDYDFSAVEKKGADGSVANAKFIDAMRQTAAELNLPKDAAARIAQSVAKYQDEMEVSGKTEIEAKLAEEKTALAQNWGNKFEANKFIATQAANKLAVAMGKKPEEIASAVSALEGQVGYKAVMEMFLAIGQKMGEDKYVDSGNSNSGVMTREQAVARLNTLKGDENWAARLLKGDTEARKELAALTTLISGDDTAASRAR
jgi:hypothetical protein